MIEVSNTYVAGVAQQAANALGIVAMINVKKSSPAWRSCFADGALAVLIVQKIAIFLLRYLVMTAKIVVSNCIRVLLSPSFLLRGNMVKIGQPPFLMSHKSAVFAVNIHAMRSVAALVKRFANFELVAAWANPSRHKFWFNHLSPPNVDNVSTLLVRAGQGGR